MNKKQTKIILIVLILYFAIFGYIFGWHNFQKFISKSYIILDDGTKFMLKNGKWVSNDESNSKLFNWQQFNIYTDNKYFGKYNVYYNNKFYIFDNLKKSVSYDSTDIMGYRGTAKINVIDFKKEYDFDNNGLIILNSYIKSNKLNLTTDDFDKKMVTFDFDNNGKDDKIYIAVSLYTGKKDVGYFVYLVNDKNKIELLDSKTSDISSQYNICWPSIDKIIDVFNDKKYELIVSCSYYSDKGDCDMMYEKSFGKYKKVVDCKDISKEDKK